MNAILGLSALHLSRIADHDPFEAVCYHDRCIEMMVPLLDDDDQVKDDALLLTSIILALYEDLDHGTNSQRHIIGTSLFLPAKGPFLSSQLRQAAFWCHLRQEIYFACSQQRTVHADVENGAFNTSMEPADDEIWVHRVLRICALVVQWAFGNDSTHTLWRELKQLVNEWDDRKPKSFAPTFLRERDPSQNRWFPQICYVTDEHVTGCQFLLLARLLLITHDPNIPRIGQRMKPAIAKMQEEARSHVRTFCGQALHNSFVPAGFIAVLSIKMCGVWFDDRDEQMRLLDVLRIVEQKSGWPKEKPEMGLIEGWGWAEERPKTN